MSGHEAIRTATVLVVEDDQTLCFSLEQGLLNEGFDVLCAADAVEAVELAGATEPDLVLLDWMLPGGRGGPHTCRALLEAVPGVRVVMLSGLDDVRDQRAALEAGAVTFLRKGVDIEEIAATLRRALPTGRFSRA